ncbi:MAG: tRNA 2-thiouridine(34) synthase MnmA, partial [Ignavibacteriaceae bacterium]|nr:tRNA 2-thiouridine(34) synthase MnmA [Ignavibacteriaceae bacterium]
TLFRSRKTFTVGKFNWITNDALPENDLRVKIRHGERSYKCSLEKNNDKGLVTLEKEDLGIAAGQFAVFYKDDICLGGSVILE